MKIGLHRTIIALTKTRSAVLFFPRKPLAELSDIDLKRVGGILPCSNFYRKLTGFVGNWEPRIRPVGLLDLDLSLCDGLHEPDSETFVAHFRPVIHLTSVTPTFLREFYKFEVSKDQDEEGRRGFDAA